MKDVVKVLPSFEEVKGELTPIPGFSPERYMAHCPSGHVYSFVSDRWLNPTGTGDGNKYLLTKIDNVAMYISEIIMSSYMGISKEDWRAMGLEIDHIVSENTKDNSISNLRLVSSTGNKKNSKDRFWNKVRLSKQTAQQLREEFKNWTGSKIEWYKMKGQELGVTARSIQNIILGVTYKEKI